VAKLTVEFAGETREVSDRLSFGRTGDLELDVNRYMHRLIGEFFADGDMWWVRNLGSRIHLTLVSDDGTRVDLPPGSVQGLASSAGVLRFNAGPARYELSYAIDGLQVPARAEIDFAGESTTQFGVILTPREVDFLVTFARPRLLGYDEPMPTYAEVAQLWGVASKTLDNTVQSLKRKLRDAGLARDEPLDVMVGLVVRHGLVTRADLAWADFDGVGPRGAADGPRFTGS
jgi:hypothetical protein